MSVFARKGLAFAAMVAAALAGCVSKTPEPRSAPPASIVAVDWSRLRPWEGMLTAEEWRAALDGRFAPNGAGKGYVEVTADGRGLGIWPGGGQPPLSAPLFYFPTRSPTTPPPAPPPGARYWRTRDELGPAPAGRPLEGLQVALDPGHLGGQWGPMEGRSFSVDGRPPVQEGDLALRVAQLLKPRLEALGAQVTLVRDHPGPVTTETPESLRPAAEAEWLAGAAAKYGTIPPPGDPRRENDIKKLAETNFYRVSEIQARARRVNDEIKPDIVLCLHLDAVDWADPQKPALVTQQHFHIMVNGAYAPAEVANDEQRLAMLERIASGAGTEELAAALAMAEAAVPIFGLPPSGYSLPTGVALGGNGYVWGRNLLANRLYRCPVVFFEPYVMNSVEGYERIQAGEYAGTRVFGGRERKNIFDEYGDAVVAGMIKYYSGRPASQSR